MAKTKNTLFTEEMLEQVVDQVVDMPAEVEEVVAEEVTEAPVAAQKHERSAKYVAARSMVDRTREYPLADAVELVKRTSYAKFDATIELHLNLKKEIKPVDVAMPFSTGKAVRVAVVNDAVVAELEAGEINFDVLIATPETMKRVMKFARLLGPKGLMPNPKIGTVTLDPEAKKAELEKGSVTVKPEKKAPLAHVRVGKKSQADAELIENIQAVLRAVNVQNISKITLAASMSPGVKVSIVEL